MVASSVLSPRCTRGRGHVGSPRADGRDAPREEVVSRSSAASSDVDDQAAVVARPPLVAFIEGAHSHGVDHTVRREDVVETGLRLRRFRPDPAERGHIPAVGRQPTRPRVGLSPAVWCIRSDAWETQSVHSVEDDLVATAPVGAMVAARATHDGQVASDDHTMLRLSPDKGRQVGDSPMQRAIQVLCFSRNKKVRALVIRTDRNDNERLIMRRMHPRSGDAEWIRLRVGGFVKELYVDSTAEAHYGIPSILPTRPFPRVNVVKRDADVRWRWARLLQQRDIDMLHSAQYAPGTVFLFEVPADQSQHGDSPSSQAHVVFLFPAHQRSAH